MWLPESSDRPRGPRFDHGSNRTQGARSTMVGPCGPRGLAWCSLAVRVRVVYWIHFSCFPMVDLEAAGVWSQLADLKDPELQRLAREVPDTLLSGKADSTVRKYIGAFQRWKLWAEARQGVPSFPAQEAHIVLYLQHLSQSVQSKSAIEEAVNALSWLHQVSGLPPVSSLPLVQAALAGHRRLLAQPKVRKEPVTAEMLKAMVVAAGPEPSLSEVRLLAICLVGFAGFMRCEELLKLECADVKFKEEGMVLSIRSSKTDQFREGDSLLVGRTGAITCPVQMMERYFRMGHLNGESHDFQGYRQLQGWGDAAQVWWAELLQAEGAAAGEDCYVGYGPAAVWYA